MNVRPPTSGFAFRVLQGSCHVLFSIGYRQKLVGLNYLNRRPAVILANHESYLDPLVICQMKHRAIVFAAKEELFDVWNGWLFPRINCIPVRRGVADKSLFRTAAYHLARGQHFCLFPEGTRSTDGVLRPAQPGAIAIALRSGVPIIPVGISGTRDALPVGGSWQPARISAEVGAPMTYPALWTRKPKRHELEAVGVRVMEEIARLRAQAAARVGNTLPEPSGIARPVRPAVG